MGTPRRDPTTTRRTALAGLGAGGLGLAMTSRGTSAQDATDMAGHPLVGSWVALTPGGAVPQLHGADGSIIAAFPPNYVDPVLGLTYQGSALGRWEADGERRGRFTFIQALSDPSGAYAGTFQLSAEIEASEDGQTWTATSTQARAIARDAANTVTFDDAITVEPPVTGVRIGATADSVVLPVVPPAAATPESGTPTT
jgi:hypothetical protein